MIVGGGLGRTPIIGKTIREFKLDAPPVWDGMCVAGGRVFVATIDGRIVSLESR